MVEYFTRTLARISFVMLSALAMALVVTSTAQSVQAQAYGIMPGDTLRIEVLEDNTLNRNALVLPDGTISFPSAGTVHVSGRSTASVRKSLSQAMAKDFAVAPTVYVSVQSLQDRSLFDVPVTDIFIMGEVNNPGVIEAKSGATLLQALAQGGGFTRFAASKRIELRRADPATGTEHTYLYNYKTGEGLRGSTLVKQGDVIVVPQRKLFE